MVVVPEQELLTSEARRVLPSKVAFEDAVNNLNALGLLIAGLADYRNFVPSAMDDFLHQPYRMPLLSFAQPLLDRLLEAGAAGSCWSAAALPKRACLTLARRSRALRSPPHLA